MHKYKTHSLAHTLHNTLTRTHTPQHTHAATHAPLQNCPAGTQNTLMQLHTPHRRTALQEHKTHSCSYTHPTADSRPLRGVIIMGCCWQEGRRLLAKREEKTVKNVQLESE